MKKILVSMLAILLVFALVACSNGDSEEKTTSKTEEIVNKESTEKGPSQQKLNEKLKKEAVKADFVELNVDNPPEGKKVYIDGEVSALNKGPMDEFVLTSKEDKGNGMYMIKLANTTDVEFSEGDQVRVYGVVNGKDDTGMPKVLATIIEKK